MYIGFLWVGFNFDFVCRVGVNARALAGKFTCYLRVERARHESVDIVKIER